MVRQVVDDIVLCKHPAGTNHDELAARLRAAAADPIRAVFAAPLTAQPIAAPDGRLVTLWPRTDAVAPDAPPPWRDAGALLARLHASAVPWGLPAHGGRARLVRAVAAADALHPGGSTDILRELGRTLLSSWPTARSGAVVHGDWDLSRLGRLPAAGGWLLTGIGSLGVGEPAWDLGGPAGLWAAGLLDEASWQAFVAGYADGGGPVPGVGLPWPALEHPAKCAVYRRAVSEVARCGRGPLGEPAETLLRACVRINGRPW